MKRSLTSKDDTKCFFIVFKRGFTYLDSWNKMTEIIDLFVLIDISQYVHIKPSKSKRLRFLKVLAIIFAESLMNELPAKNMGPKQKPIPSHTAVKSRFVSPPSAFFYSK